MDASSCPRAPFGEACTAADPCISCWRRREISPADKIATVVVHGRFMGPANVSSDAVQEFWETGSAEVFDRQRVTRRLSRAA